MATVAGRKILVVEDAFPKWIGSPQYCGENPAPEAGKANKRMIAMLSNLTTVWLVLTILSIGLSVSAGELLGTARRYGLLW